MKTLRIINEKYYVQEEIKLSASDIELAIKEYLESRIAKFQKGWNISVDYPMEAKAVCSKWAGFTCPKCSSSMTINHCNSDGCNKLVCEETENLKMCCGCAN
ncbi:MAG TPA: hypothetical protein PKY82_10340 [Pyrinomonadaceae bacterium]|nr:hypothetical protein [Pyrinomonadaceae bacterium]